MKNKNIDKIVLAYSGGADTSVALKWLQEEYGCEVITFTADIGQGGEIEEARQRAIDLGVKHIIVDDLREEFVRDYVFPMFRANTLYEGEYLLGTAIARPLISKRLVELARQHNATTISHGATGKGNDQLRFELGAIALMPEVKVIAPWREWQLNSRVALTEYCIRHGINLPQKDSRRPDYSMDANLLHISYEGGVLEDPRTPPPDELWKWTVSPMEAPDKVTELELTFTAGDLVAIDGEDLSPATALTKLNQLAGSNGVGRVDIVENRAIGMKSRGCYETPGGTVLLKAHRAIESLCLDKEAAHLKDALMPKYASLIYDGLWWSPERYMLQAAIDECQKFVNGRVRLQLYKGNVIVIGRESADYSLYDANISTFDDDGGNYQQKDAAGFITLNALRLRLAALRGN